MTMKLPRSCKIMYIDGNKGHITEKAKDSSQAKPSVVDNSGDRMQGFGDSGVSR